ncbi:MAG TPA: DUF2085 domain-containing protein [Patescibacteria group bacterium]|nr:DUF2085 domain-containing protein [Patescibacteria group bacterium]
MNTAHLRPWSRPFSQRAFLLLVVIMALLILGFYTVTDSGRLEQHTILEGADYAGYAVCHRITDRSFTIAGRQLPLCARCTGMYLGVVLTFVVLILAGRRRWSMMPPLRVIIVLLGFIVLFGVDGLNSYSHFFPELPHLYQPQNWLRLITGVGAGLMMGIILFPALAQSLWRDQEQKPAIGSLRELAGVVFLAAIVVALVLGNEPTILYVLGLASAGGVVMVLTAINATALLIITRRDAQAINIRQAILPLGIGLALAIIQIGVISFIRYSFTGTMTGLPGL